MLTLDNSVYRTSFLTKATVNALGGQGQYKFGVACGLPTLVMSISMASETRAGSKS